MQGRREAVAVRRPVVRRRVEASVETRILRSWTQVGALSAGLSIVSMGKEMVVAASFGTGDAVDAFVVALLPLLFVVTALADALAPALIPAYVQEREQRGPEAAQDLFSQILALAGPMLAAAAAVVAFLAPHFLPLLGFGFDADKLAQTQRLLYLLLPFVVVSGVSAVWATTLQAGERFWLAGAAPMLPPAASVLAVLAWGPALGIEALAAGLVLGASLRLALLGWGLKRCGTALTPRWRGGSPAVRRVIGQYLPMVVGAATMSGLTLVDGAMAAALAPGSVAALNYGNKVVAGLTSVGAGALGTVTLPVFSRLTAAGDWAAVRRVVRTYSGLILLTTVPAALALFVLSEPLVGLIFERGEFNSADTRLVGRVQALYGLQIPFYLLGVLFVRLIASAGSNHLLMVGALLNLGLNVVLNYVFMQRLGVVGIALSTACVYCFSCGFLVIVSFRTFPGLRRADAGGRRR